MRGQQSLFNDVFAKKEKKTTTQRPRNFFLPERNEALLYRYYYHAEINRYRYDVCLEELEKEFYITSLRIVFVLSENAEKLSEIVNNKPPVNEIAKIFPHFNWK